MSARPRDDGAGLLDHLELAKEAASRAGEYLRSRPGLAVLSARGKDIKLEADLRSEAMILDFLARETDFPILSEERGLVEGRSRDGKRWIIDPLDGTFNYRRGIPLCCVSVALWEEQEPLVGVVYDFVHDELFSGVAEVGAWLNGEAIEVGEVSDPAQAILVTGFPLEWGREMDDMRDFAGYGATYKKVRLLGSAALSLAYVAAARADCYREQGIMLWDVAGGLAVLAAAGGCYSIEERAGGSQSFSVYASNGRLSPVAKLPT
ncbi:MAG: inositol monophosphatase [Gemmatimonadetes bacterium]|nr:inositol monophosphatase [Gemmatimonadota bacterium]